MSKGYILVDMPKSCRDCEFFGFVCRITNEKCEYYNEDGRSDWCPIRELPKKWKYAEDIRNQESLYRHTE